MKKMDWKQNLAKTIEKGAIYSASESVGKSYPSFLYEVEVPKILKTINLEELKLRD